MSELDLDTILKIKRQKKAVSLLLQAKARIRELTELVDMIERQGVFDMEDLVELLQPICPYGFNDCNPLLLKKPSESRKKNSLHAISSETILKKED
jgi:muconolactone delta-isomerase